MKRAVSILLVSMFATPAFAQTSPATPGVPVARKSAEAFDVSPTAMREAARAQALSQQQWQEQYDLAKKSRSGGLHKVVVGLLLDAGGAVAMIAGAESCAVTLSSSVNSDCGGSGALVGLGAVAALGGAVSFWWGVIQYVGANGDVHSLEATRPGKAPSQVINLTEHQAIQLQVGTRSSVGYRVSW